MITDEPVTYAESNQTRFETDDLTRDTRSVGTGITLPPDEILERRFHLVTGKGGVGKSTVAMTLGIAFAQRGLRTLICEVDHREMMTRAFQVPPSQAAIKEVSDQLYVVSIDTQTALSEYGMLKLKVRALSSLLTENPITRALVSIVPGVADLIALGKAFNHERERDQQGYVWDRVIVDAPSTGHGLTFIRLPQVIRDVVPYGNMRREADEMWALLSDSSRSAIHIVTTPEELPAQETLELWRKLNDDLDLQPHALWINMDEPQVLSDDDWSVILEAQSHTQLCPQVVHMLKCLDLRRCGTINKAQYLSRLAQIKAPRAKIPQILANTPSALRVIITTQLRRLSAQLSSTKLNKVEEDHS